ncbi:MAG: Gfo/Idh/MocA family oxidoreductase, partial [Pyrinomonadaceae bacterium]|nr:Gfo/Idh/MocA family oxidoreductase [Phycisphaerales bacterium]
ADANVDALSICTQTDTHVELALAAIAAGKHVLIEKPVAVTLIEVERVAAAAKGAKTRDGKALVCMPGLCMRFWPGWPFVRECVRDGRFGKVKSATFHRLGTPPRWSNEFYLDAARSGGALVDLHIHDADFIRWCFGDPESVSSVGSTNHLTTVYKYANGPGHVVAEGGWGHSPGFGFRMRYVISFEGATVDFDLARTPTVLVHRDGKSEAAEIQAKSAYQLQMEHFVGCIARPGEVEQRARMGDAAGVARLLERERESLEKGGRA